MTQRESPTTSDNVGVEPLPRVPGVGGDPRETTGQTEGPPGKTWFRDLDEAVIESDRCIQCGTCVAACPSDSIGIDSELERPTLVRMCTGCSRCWDFCPRSGLRYERHVEAVQADRPEDVAGTYAARARQDGAAEAGQDGGVVTALLAELIERGELDGAVIARENDDEPLHGEAYLATSREELVANAGSVYNQTMQLGRIDELVEEAGLEDPDLAVVGTPCVVQGATALNRYGYEGELDHVALTVALMCTRSFEADRLRGAIADFGVDPAAVDRLDVDAGTLYAYDVDGEELLAEPVDAFDEAGLKGCLECADFVGGAADISAGSVGSPDGYTTVVVRSEAGRRAWEQAEGGLEAELLEEETAIRKIVAWNRGRAEDALPREYDPEGDLDITYDEHRAAYDGTDREAKPLNPARVHQYEEWC